ncbi:MAG: YMGG-like glycine zipper-containing protein [Bacteroidota bacterium]
MKKLLVALSMVAVFASCNSKPKETVVVIDTTAIKQKAILEEQARVKAEADAKALNDERAKLEAERNRLAATRRRISSGSGSSTASNPNVGTSANAPVTGSGTATEAPKKKGWSDAAKGTAIGAGVGALGGILIDKNDARGAIIGGVVGAAGGYIIGRAKDRKTGRVQPKQPPQQ